MHPAPRPPRQRAEAVTFQCSQCELTYTADYFGRRPPYAPAITLFEDAYCCRDPYSTAARHITLGSRCAVCSRPVCVHPACSVFYTTRLCRDCVYTHQSLLPAAVVTDVCPTQGMARAVRQDENAQKQAASDLLRPK